MSKYVDKYGNEIPDEAFENDAGVPDKPLPDRYGKEFRKELDAHFDELKEYIKELRAEQKAK